MKQKLWENRTKLILIAGTAVVFLFFALISHWTPVSGDDWVYAVGGMWNNPFTQAFHMYQTWSGRYLSELWGFLVAPHKGLWNILNPLFFTLIFILLNRNSDQKVNKLPAAVLSIVLMLSVANRLRMQTYTWIMGTTYVIPLLLFLIQLYLLKQWIFEDKKQKWTIPVLCLLNFCIPLYMENAAALMVGSDFLVLIYLSFTDQKKMKQMVIPVAFAVTGTLIILLSPGASARLTGDNAAFNQLSLFQKLAQNWPQFLFHTFTESIWITNALLVVFAGYAWVRKKSTAEGWIIAGIVTISLFLSNAWVYFLLIVGVIVYLAIREEDMQLKWYGIYLILCALGASIVMLVSPIFDSRSALYTVYLWILLTLVLFGRLQLTAAGKNCLLVLFVLLAGMRMLSYYRIYHLVHLINIRRNQQIEYYRVRPDAGDAWILAYPDESIHSPNVQEGDDTHMYYFKEYYYLNQDLHLVFYYLKDYNAETIFEVNQ